ncbi:hypothetical protein AVEN_106175-1 [Araneus ventricosus]|uniref:Uncharacterized protein n=1 Tax=Araneus ventricosus TaxID=182803 RepID=A0A4Y2REH4_ARAVE|nr:hypothetical protein AVEN_106175-1 [Araneus ventricosus]
MKTMKYLVHFQEEDIRHQPTAFHKRGRQDCFRLAKTCLTPHGLPKQNPEALYCYLCLRFQQNFAKGSPATIANEHSPPTHHVMFIAILCRNLKQMHKVFLKPAPMRHLCRFASSNRCRIFQARSCFPAAVPCLCISNH